MPISLFKEQLNKERTIHQVVQQMEKQLDIPFLIQPCAISEDKRYIFRQCLAVNLQPLELTRQTELINSILQTLLIPK